MRKCGDGFGDDRALKPTTTQFSRAQSVVLGFLGLQQLSPLCFSKTLRRPSRTGHETATLSVRWTSASRLDPGLVVHVNSMPQRSVHAIQLLLTLLRAHIRRPVIHADPQHLSLHTLTLSPAMQLAVVFASSFTLYFVWLLVRNYLVRSPLDKIPGPPSAAIISGT